MNKRTMKNNQLCKTADRTGRDGRQDAFFLKGKETRRNKFIRQTVNVT